MSKQRICFLQVSDQLLNPDDANNPADNYFKAIWHNMVGEGYYRPEHFWEIPTWIAELSYCLNSPDNELMLYHIDKICPDDCPTPSQHDPLLPDADIYFASVMDCNKEILRTIVKKNPDKIFYLGGYIGIEEFYKLFNRCYNVIWCESIEDACSILNIDYRYRTGNDLCIHQTKRAVEYI